MAIPSFVRCALLFCMVRYPTRVVFDKNLRSAQVDLINNGSDPATYRLSLVNPGMDETGDF